MASGGVGGSGTRLIARLLIELGFFMGSDLNASVDNLWFTLLFKRPEILAATDEEFAGLLEIFVARMTGGAACTADRAALVRRLAASDRPQHPSDWLSIRADSLLAAGADHAGPTARGWKEPNTHIVVDRLQRALPEMRYIQVVRNGLDMAHSANQNQLRLWGERFLGPGVDVSPYYSLKYWHRVHKRLLTLGEPMGERFYLLNYDSFCSDPAVGLERLLGFLQLRIPASERDRLLGFVTPPGSIGRFKNQGIDIFDPSDVRFVARLGFDVGLD